MKALRWLIVAGVLCCFTVNSAISSPPQETGEEHATAEKKFDPGTFILDHILDNYEWHIATAGHTHISIPLPVILYSKTKGLNVFFSSKFHHGHSVWNGFMIAHDGNAKGKIVELNPDGTPMRDAKGNYIRPLDFSITKNVFALLISIGLLLWVFLPIAARYKKAPLEAPKGIQNALEVFILFVRDQIARPSLGEKKYERYMPYLLTAFFFIFFNNLLGLLPIFPGGANVTGNIAVTLVLALFTFLITNFSGNRNYWKHIFNPPVPGWLKLPVPLMPLIEFSGIIIKPFVLMVRLFANISAGHIIALGFFCLIFIFGEMNVYAGFGSSIISVVFVIFMSMLEFLVAFIQAFVFTLLSAIYIGMATEEHHH